MMATQQTWISIARTTADDVFSNDQSGDMTAAQAAAIAERFNELFRAQVEAAYPDADIEVGQGNGIDGVSVSDDHGREDAIRWNVGNIAQAIWDGDGVWTAATR